VPLIVILAKYDILVSKIDAELRKVLVRGLRFFCHVLCGHFLAVSVHDKMAMVSWRTMLKALLFSEYDDAIVSNDSSNGKSGGGTNIETSGHKSPLRLQGVKPVSDMTRNFLCIPAGHDSIHAIGPPLPGSAANPNGVSNDLGIWQKAIESCLPKSRVSTSESEGGLTDDGLSRFPEKEVDGMVAQKADELRNYKRKVDQKLRLQAGKMNV